MVCEIHHIKDKIPSFNLIYGLTCSDIRLQSNEGKISMTHAPVLSNLKGTSQNSTDAITNLLVKLVPIAYYPLITMFLRSL